MAELKLKKGMKVRVYQKPYTREDFEGVGTLQAQFMRGHERPPFETWKVRFHSDEFYVRMVSPEDVVA